MKAILVMEMPENCERCECLSLIDIHDRNTVFCTGSGLENHHARVKPDWCPLKPMPERKEEKYDLLQKDDSGDWRKCGEQTDLFGAGWNACIEAVEGSKG